METRGIRHLVHLTDLGLSGPVVRNVVPLIYRGSMVWFQSINDEADVMRVYALTAAGFLPDIERRRP